MYVSVVTTLLNYVENPYNFSIAELCTLVPLLVSTNYDIWKAKMEMLLIERIFEPH